jgi:hypothetical protein
MPPSTGVGVDLEAELRLIAGLLTLVVVSCDLGGSRSTASRDQRFEQFRALADRTARLNERMWAPFDEVADEVNLPEPPFFERPSAPCR